MPTELVKFRCGRLSIDEFVLESGLLDQIGGFLKRHLSGDEGEASPRRHEENARVFAKRDACGVIVSNYPVKEGVQISFLTTPVYFGSGPYKEDDALPDCKTTVYLRPST